MAKKRGPGRPKGSGKKNKKKPDAHSVPGGFWRQVFAIILILLAMLFAVGLIGIGGSFLAGVGRGLYMLFGYASVFIPFLFLTLSIQIFRAEDNKLSSAIWFCTLIFLILWSALFQLMAADPLSAPKENFSGPGGGNIGWFLSFWLLPNVSAGVLAVIYVFLIMILAMFIFSLSPKEVFTKISQFFQHQGIVIDTAAPAGDRDAHTRSKRLPDRRAGKLTAQLSNNVMQPGSIEFLNNLYHTWQRNVLQ